MSEPVVHYYCPEKYECPCGFELSDDETHPHYGLKQRSEYTEDVTCLECRFRMVKIIARTDRKLIQRIVNELCFGDCDE